MGYFQSSFQFCQGGRNDKYRNRAKILVLFYLSGTLDIDIQDDICSGIEHLFYRANAGAVKVAVHLRPFQKIPFIAHLLETIPVNEVITMYFESPEMFPPEVELALLAFAREIVGTDRVYCCYNRLWRETTKDGQPMDWKVCLWLENLYETSQHKGLSSFKKLIGAA